MQDFHHKIDKQIEEINANYILQANLKKRLGTFNIGDYVVVQIHPEWFFLELLCPQCWPI